MKSYCKKHKKNKVKKIFIWLTCIICVAVICVLYSFAYITKNANLDKTKLTSSSNYITYISTKADESTYGYIATDINKLNDYTLNAFVAKEDKRFYKHNGLDYIRIAGALKNNIKDKSLSQGGSTITQQLVKITHTNGERTLKRKLNEAKLALILEDNYSKKEILEMYLNKVYFGSGCTGIEMASQKYFSKTASELSIAESCILCGILPSPSKYNPIADLEISKSKAKIVLNLMKEQNYITDTEYTNALNEINNFNKPKSMQAKDLYLSYATAEAEEILNVTNLSELGNVEIITYLNEDLQNTMQQKIDSGDYTIANKNQISPDFCSLVLDNESGGIIAFAGVSNFNLTKIKRQPASTIKPLLVYSPAFENNSISPATLILDEPINIKGYSPHNASKTNYGYTSVRDSLIKSLNIPAVKILNENGISYSKNFATKCGINFDPKDDSLAIALGGLHNGITFLELAGGYMTLANGGEYIKPHFVKQIKVNGSVVYTAPLEKTKVMQDYTAYLTTNILQDVSTKGTARKLGKLNYQVASKTGTNAINDNYLDGFNISYTTKHTILVWVGNTSGEEGNMNPQENGSTYPTLFTREVLDILYKNTLPEDFDIPNSVTQVKLNKQEYLLNHNLVMLNDAENSTTEYIVDWFSLSNLPQKNEILVTNNFSYENKLFNYYMM